MDLNSDRFLINRIQIIIELMHSTRRRSKKRASSGVYLKVIALGDSGVGKTSLVTRYIGGFYQDSMAPTIGVDFKIKSLQIKQQKVNLQIWDTAGQQKFKTLTKSYFQGSNGVVLLFSLFNKNSFKSIQQWLNQLDQYSDSKLVKILVGSKADSPDLREVSIEQIAQLTTKHSLEYFQVSSKTGYNVDNVFEYLAYQMMSVAVKIPCSSGFKRESQEDNIIEEETKSFKLKYYLQHLSGEKTSCQC